MVANWPDRGWVLAFLADDDERHCSAVVDPSRLYQA